MDIVVLLFLFALKHIVADYFAQLNRFKVGDKRADGWWGVFFIANHAAEHGVMTLLVVGLAALLGVPLPYYWLAIPYIDFGTHFVIDYVKIEFEKRCDAYFETIQRLYWRDTRQVARDTRTTILWVDQTLHGVVTLFLIYILLV